MRARGNWKSKSASSLHKPQEENSGLEKDRIPESVGQTLGKRYVASASEEFEATVGLSRPSQ